MKKYLSIIVIMTLLLSTCSSASYAYTSDTPEIDMNNTLRLSGEYCSEDIKEFALQHLETMKSNLSGNPEVLGFNAFELSNLQLGNPFSIYVFDENIDLVSSDTHVFPLIYQGNIVGIIECNYDSITNSYSFTFGKSYGAQLNELQSKYSRDDCELIIGHIGDKLFATDGKNAVTLLEKKIEGSSTLTINQINLSSLAIVAEASSDYFKVKDIIVGANLTSNNSVQDVTMMVNSNPLPVPHVSQTGVCGIAAWAVVLNYRFGESYSSTTLATAMKNGGYVNGSNGIPNMDDYKNYANDNYNAKCVRTSAPPSFSTLRSTINMGKPIMGSWYSGAMSDKVWHAIIITGYIQNTSNHTYYLKNPWYDYAQTITVTNASSVIYSDAGYTWNLTQTVY